MTVTAPEQSAPPAPPATEYRDPRAYVKPEVWDREIALLMRDYPFDEVMATRLLHAAVSYLITAMEKWGQGLEMCCGRIVDIAVHVLILDTRN
ncbi:hypothetical protein ACFVDH_04335 [Streptomyces sp. NPDC057674]|uniref:hypothetical protein n=1 Tax=Streptomyces sp. NPDC057674 TaxID=3346203 RepID=UPI003676657A